MQIFKYQAYNFKNRCILIKASFIYNLLNNLLDYYSCFPIYRFLCTRLISLILLFLLLFFIPSFIHGNEFYSIDKATLKEDEFGYLHLFGEIKNNSDKTITNITLSSKFLDIDNNVIGIYTRTPEINTLNPNQSSPFDIIYLEPTSVEKIKNFSLSAEYKVGKEKPQLLYINHINDRLDFTGFYYINGKITNKGTFTANNVTIIATIYDKDKNIIGITKAITEPFVIGSKDKAAFGLAINARTDASKMKDFSLQAYSDNYLSNTFISKK